MRQSHVAQTGFRFPNVAENGFKLLIFYLLSAGVIGLSSCLVRSYARITIFFAYLISQCPRSPPRCRQTPCVHSWVVRITEVLHTVKAAE